MNIVNLFFNISMFLEVLAKDSKTRFSLLISGFAFLIRSWLGILSLQRLSMVNTLNPTMLCSFIWLWVKRNPTYLNQGKKVCFLFISAKCNFWALYSLVTSKVRHSQSGNQSGHRLSVMNVWKDELTDLILFEMINKFEIWFEYL